jgi:hypothetical protein
MRLRVFLHAVLAVGAAGPGKAVADVEALHRLEVLAIDEGLAQMQLVART